MDRLETTNGQSGRGGKHPKDGNCQSQEKWN